MNGTAQELRRWRRLPLPGELLVQVGQPVAADTVVAQYRRPGPVVAVNVAGELDMDAGDVPAAMIVTVGEMVEAGQVLARTRSFLGFGGGECRARGAGRLISVSELTGQVVIEGPGENFEVRAWLAGVVGAVDPGRGVEIVSHGVRIAGVFGIGGDVCGRLRCLVERDEPLTCGSVTDGSLDGIAGAVLVGGASVTVEALRAAVEGGAVALITGGVDDLVLRDFLGRDVDAQNTGNEDAGLTLLVTARFGAAPQPLRLWLQLRDLEGRMASVSGATRLRAGVKRPEILIPVTDLSESHDDKHEASPGKER